jgi:hypothetical protein
MIPRREFITLLGGAAAWPRRAQQPTMPVIGYLNLGSPEFDAPRLTGLRRGLNQTGYVEGRNFVIEYRWAENQPDRLSRLAVELVRLQVKVFCLLEPEAHVHFAVHRRRGREIFVGLRRADAAIDFAETKVAVGDERIMCRSLSVPANCSRKLGNTCPRLGINCCSA